MASTPSPLGVLSIVNGYPKRTLSRPSGRACCFVFRVPVGYWGTPVGPTPHPGPAVHSLGLTALHHAAMFGNRRIVQLLIAFNADVNAQSHSGCAVSARGESGKCGGRVPAAVCRAGPRRCTLPRTMATPTRSPSCCCAAPTGPSRPTSGTAALRRTAETETKAAARGQGNAEDAGAKVSSHAVRGCGETGAFRPPPAPSASSCTVAPAGRSVEHVAREPLLPSAAQSAHAHAVLCRAQRCGSGTKRTQAHVPREAVRVRLSAHSADGFEFGGAGRAAASGV
jgi:hypothetical protein